MEDQVTFPFCFKVTLRQIKSLQSHRAKIDGPKSILIKLGTKQGKAKEINQCIELNIDILYSKTLNKFCPIKGIIKIYDINPDGTQMISCVGSFNTEQLLNNNQNNSSFLIERDIGHLKVQMLIEVTKIPQQPEQKPKIEKPTIEQQFLKNQKISSELDCHETPYIMDDSVEIQSNSEVEPSEYSDFSEDIRQNQKQIIGQELVLERRKNQTLEEKIEKDIMKINILRKNIQQKNIQIKSFISNFRDFTTSLECDAKGQYIFELNEHKKQAYIRYKDKHKFRSNFDTFLTFMTKKIQEYSCLTTSISTDKIMIEDTTTKLIRKIEANEEEKNTIQQENTNLKLEIQKLSNQLKLKQNKNGHCSKLMEAQMVKKSEQIVLLNKKLQKINEQYKNQKEINKYLKDKDTNMENIISQKQHMVQTFKNKLAELKAQFNILSDRNQQLEEELCESKEEIENYRNTIDELNEENSNLSETIEDYRKQFGDLKAAKDKALERQLKECLRWIDQQNRDEELSLEENTLSFSESHGVNSIIKSMDEIENMPLEDISVIRKEVVNVLKKLDELIAKNGL